ncbi:MAG TPA: NAD(P)/FAD-dependent oxidoreductase [Clostridiaceae bacterium]
MSKVIVIGGGPAGMMAAISAAQKHQVVLIEKNEKLGKKLYITGKGRCNVTSSKEINEFFNFISSNPSFLYSSFYGFTNQDLMNFFEEKDLELKVERGDRVFPKSDKSSDIIYTLNKELQSRNVDIHLNSKVEDIIAPNNRITKVKLSDNSFIEADYYILATGGLSYPQTGSSGDGYKFSKKLGHKIVSPHPGLIPMETVEEWPKTLQGLSLKNSVLKIKNENGKIMYEEMGELLFTHFGISGPLVLTASSKLDEKNAKVASIDLKPALSYEELDKRIQRDFMLNLNKSFKNSLDDILPQKLINVIIGKAGIDENKKVNLITKEERKSIVEALKNLEMHIKGYRPIGEAIITKGGISTKEVDPSTMKSKLIENLYFAGEILDVDGETGGFNLQIAFSTGHLAGELNIK